ncbi:transcription elongation factor s-ii protein [Diplodia corticola]|uniref:Transcription elongation factor s-ii protein n=1 Tax=Diplodia corticola TaxID=236234 RepID=A0A1J9RLT7_9PEZI|nr:transcription elongation factor s-ii protein [Diplodia corticola]OJD29471.1 transcription elongation factor s-ii protein [Diplodia corticola]
MSTAADAAAPSAANPHDRATLLRHRAQAFCKALLSPPPPRDLISQFLVKPPPPPPAPAADPSSGSQSPGSPPQPQPQPTILEHGPHWATSQGRLPFVGTPFVGAAACERYFELLGASLRMHLDEGSFPGGDGFVVDVEADATAGGRGVGVSVDATGHHHHHHFHLWEPAKKVAQGLLWHGSGNPNGAGGLNHGLKGTVTVVGRGTFESVKTGRKWREEFVYVLGGWDGEGRFERWEIWADPLSAWVAVGEGEVEGWPKGEFAKAEGVREVV